MDRNRLYKLLCLTCLSQFYLCFTLNEIPKQLHYLHQHSHVVYIQNMKMRLTISTFTLLIMYPTLYCCISKPSRPTPAPVEPEPEDDGTEGTISTTTSKPSEATCSYSTDKLVSIDDYEGAAIKILNENANAYYSTAADEEITYRDNVLAYKRYTMRPRAMVDVSHTDISTTILGKAVSLPIGVSPTGIQKLGCLEGEIATAKAAAEFGSIYIVSTFSTTKIEDIAQAAPNGRNWMQVYFFKQRAVTTNLVRRAESSGFEAIVVTVDSPVSGSKRDQKRLPFVLPPNLKLANFGTEMGDLLGVSGRPVHTYDLSSSFDANSTWDDIIWLKGQTKLPIFLKGILNADDAEMGIRYGASGIFVSNHGGRQLDTVISTIDILPEITQRLKPYNTTIIVDGGVRKGTDIFKALAFGAHMVFAGRPFIWGLSISGEKGVKNIFTIFRDEFNSTMALAGVASVDEIDESYVGRSISPQPL